MGTAPTTTPSAAGIATFARPAPEQLKRTRRWLMVAGVLSLLGGIVAIALPNIASVATTIFVGWLLVFISALHTVDALSAREDRKRMALRLLLAALTFAAGLYLLVAPLEGTFTLTVMLVIWFVAIGCMRIAIGVAGWGAPGARWLALGGVLSLVLGLLIAEQLPESAAWALGLLVGIDMLFSGVQLIDFSRRLRT
jgi:uncharacterized membrane protein HdeD (DUF308 family)